MDTRKVQRTGKSTYIVSLPKSWATKHGISAGSLIYINQSENGALVLSPERSEQDLNIKLNIGDKSGEPLVRDIIACYVSGYRTIELTSSRMSSSQKKSIHQIVSKLIGPEVLEETINKVLIQDLLSSEELQAERALRRIRTVVKSMIQDSLNSLVEGNRDLASDVIERDDDVDRLHLLISRQFTEILRSGTISQGEIDPITAFNYSQAASNLERMADHAHAIAQVVMDYEVSLPPDLVAELKRLESLFGNLIEESISSLLHLNSEKANAIIEQTREVRLFAPLMTKPAQKIQKDEMMVRVMVSGSIERMLDYITNIGELTINLSHAHGSVEAG
ncbi:MAG: transcriptional regulator PhoU [Methanosaeta sp. PtaB.Bin039]|nr:MAG: transcriptional regulator PhoU [Methanosaeta sp. PtaB.Bin039]OPY46552.1 MAG: transcriptional regulator PhoU [Methanosaeta sp. PtaU1.Bin028]HOT08072.1 PhoU domain-containing protein [Methanotrichaceae archaeon]HQF17531.1 PhoU domain-containing protein [Methanotrichaceae archaeon]HQI92126.1 PhoU domain-containing protein [Methanotrichaceae archaeon]